MLKELIIRSSIVPLKKLTLFYGLSNVAFALQKKGVETYVFPMNRSEIFNHFKSVPNKDYVLDVCKHLLGLDEFKYDESTEKFTVDRLPNMSMEDGLSGGTAQILGVISIATNTDLFGGENNALNILQPEASLHPKSQSALGNFLVEFLLLNNSKNSPQLFFDTWSEHLMNGIRIGMMKNYNKNPNTLKDVVINYTTDGMFISLFVDKKGSLSTWPKGFMDQTMIDLSELMKARI